MIITVVFIIMVLVIWVH